MSPLMGADETTHRLLEEIRDAQREHLAEYRRVTLQSLELQKRAVDRQELIGRTYRRIALLGGLLVTVLLGLLAYLLVRWSSYLFR